MGYTHFLYRAPEFVEQPWQRAVEQASQACRAVTAESHSIAICGPEGYGVPLFDSEGISFNGDADRGLAVEPFIVPRTYVPYRRGTPLYDGMYFSYCKTEHMPYDLLVTASLVILKYHLGDDVRITSNGKYSDWLPAIRLVNDLFTYFPDDKFSGVDFTPAGDESYLEFTRPAAARAGSPAP